MWLPSSILTEKISTRQRKPGQTDLFQCGEKEKQKVRHMFRPTGIAYGRAALGPGVVAGAGSLQP